MSFRVKISSQYLKPPQDQVQEKKIDYSDLSKNLKNPSSYSALLSNPQPENRPKGSSDSGMSIRTDIRSQSDFM